jgi:hypothetical protein
MFEREYGFSFFEKRRLFFQPLPAPKNPAAILSKKRRTPQSAKRLRGQRIISD